MAYPLEQGLKPRIPEQIIRDKGRLNGLSTRTRIETPVHRFAARQRPRVLMAYPLEQGLKLS